ncbi:hypothetical protein A0H81_13698 [Grifola frondosa]|uniref:Uncharacterized protein n=1 Tax=Grifola frondosa TaxID=5627 RepID=A0A1C7LPF6_GRIFR|nr:hypothetical protein A0H81_13698 [Grifola frondosa]
MAQRRLHPSHEHPAIQLLLQSPTHQSPPAASNLFDVVPTPARVPFAATTRPLNVSPKPASSLPPSPTVPLSMPKHPALQLQRRKSGSPPIGPSPLRRSSLRQSSSYPASVSSSDLGVRLRASATTVSTTRGSWELEDLVRDGQLDIDAVSAVLGLGLGLGMDAGSRSSAASSADGEQDECAMERASMGWGRAREAGTTVLQLRVPGEPLFAIPEETGAEDAATAGEPEHGSNARRECVVSVSLDHLFVSANAGEVSEGSVCAEIGVWEDERSWRESVSIR